MESNEPKTCFIIMPFGEKPDLDGEIINFNDVYKYIIKEVIVNRFGFTCIRSDEVMQAGWIHAEMIDHLFRADIVIVDITSLNPNVFYELGVRHALKPAITILLRKKGTELPFDIRGFRVISYNLDIRSANQAKEDIEQYIRNGLAKRTSDSIVYQVFPGLKVSLD